MDLVLPGNFPFGTPESAQFVSSEKVLGLLDASREEALGYLRCYISLYQPFIPICDISKLEVEIEQFWESPDSVDASWLAQYLAVLGLVAFAVNKDAKKASDYFFASEVCLAKTSYMFRPTVMNIRTLCLLVMAKQVSFATCWALDACWNIMGTT